MSAAVPHLSSIADELTFIKSVYTDQFNHGPAELLLYTGIPRTAGRPSMGSWITYGLGSENRNLPGFVVFVSQVVRCRAVARLDGEAAFFLRFIKVFNAGLPAIQFCT